MEDARKGYGNGRAAVDVLLKFPFTIIEGADLAGLEPARDAVEVESVLLKWRWRKEGQRWWCLGRSC